MTKVLLATTMLAGLLTAGVAQAADMPLKAPPRAAPYYTDWTGFYLFGFGGYSWGKISGDDVDLGRLFLGNGHNPKPKGGVFGFGGGYNWQYGAWVGGVEVDYGFSNEKETQTFSFRNSCGDGCPTFTDNSVLHSKIDTLGSARLRVGYLIMPNVLAYGTAGAGWSRAEFSFSEKSCSNDDCNSTSIVAKPNLFGWVAGGGIEFKLFDHLRLRGEYLHYDFGSTTYSGRGF